MKIQNLKLGFKKFVACLSTIRRMRHRNERTATTTTTTNKGKTSFNRERKNTMADNDGTAAATTTATSITLHLTVTAEQGAPRVPLQIQPTTTTATQLRHAVSTATKIPLASLKLIFRGRLIADNDVQMAVEEFKLEDGSVLHCMGKPVVTNNNDEAAVSTAAGASTSSVIAPSAAAAAAPTVPVASAAVNLLPTQPQAAAVGNSTLSNLQAALQTLRSYNPPKVYQTAVQTLDKILVNITTHPLEEKYRTVKKQNAAFTKRLGGLQGGDDAMRAAGFVVELDAGEQVYRMRPSPEAWPRLMATKAMLEAAVRDAQTSLHPATAAAAAPVVAVGGGGLGMPGFPGGMGGGMAMMPDAMQQQAAANLMANPAALQQMLQVRTQFARSFLLLLLMTNAWFFSNVVDLPFFSRRRLHLLLLTPAPFILIAACTTYTLLRYSPHTHTIRIPWFKT
jgi:PUB domain/Ubiquitin family